MSGDEQGEGEAGETPATRGVGGSRLSAARETARRGLSWAGMALCVVLILVGGGGALAALVALGAPHHSYQTFYYLPGLCIGVPLLVVGGLCLAALVNRASRDALAVDWPAAEEGAAPKADLACMQARAAAGRCPNCDSVVAPADQNCPQCRINLVWAREHLEELAGRE